jgi:cytochrome c oxidase subunit 2
MSNNVRHFVIVAVLVAIIWVLTYFLLLFIYPLPLAASTQANSIDQMINVHFILIAFFFALIVAFMGYSFVAFRRRPGDESDGEHFHGNTALEIIWTIVPLIVVISLGVWAAFVLADITSAEPNELVVNVRGRQWSWVFAYPDYEEVGVTDELVMPVDRPVRLELVTDDVLHSFWVPEFRVKQDLVPGVPTVLRFTPDVEGAYKVRCAEICGLNHAYMVNDVRVVSNAEFDEWVADQSVSLANLTAEDRGAKWAADYGCIGCHTIDGSDSVGPTWLGVFGREEPLTDGNTVEVDGDYLVKSIYEPGLQIVEGFNDVMPATFEDQFAAKEAELQETGVDVNIAEDIVAYIASLEE